MEVRSRLRSCNVFMTTDIDFANKCNLKINLRADCIVLSFNDHQGSENCDDEGFGYVNRRYDSLSSIESYSDSYSEDDTDYVTEIIDIKEFCRIIPNSMSGLKIEKGNISFRLLTEPKEGNVYNEVFNETPNSALLNNGLLKSKINIPKLHLIKLFCNNCTNRISADIEKGCVKFNRILELPSTNLDVSEWFCHKHGEDAGTNGEIDKLTPDKSDIFYRICYFNVNADALNEKCNFFNKNRVVYHCNRCLAWLGTKSLGKNVITFYNSTVNFSEENSEIKSDIFTYSSLEVNNSLLVESVSCQDFVYLIEFMVKDFNLGMQYAVMCKLLLECQISAAKKQYMLLWIMDRELQILKASELGSVVDNSDEVFRDDLKINLVSAVTSKLLYRVEESLNDTVEGWIADPCVVTSEISKGMFLNGLSYLERMSCYVPEGCRQSNGYFVSYLRM